MNRSLWLGTVLAGALGCGSLGCGSSDSPTSDESTGSASNPVRTGGMKADAGTKKPTSSGASDPANHPNVHVDKYGNPIDDAGAEGPDTCEKLSLPANPNSPEILIVLDRSGSMIGLGGGANRWMPSVAAIKQLTSDLTETVAFGLLTFPAPLPPGMMGGGGITIPGVGTFPTGPGGGGASSCLPGKLQVPVDLNNADMIASVLDMSTPDFGATPTADSLAAAKEALDTGTCGDCPEKPKYVLLVTDGQPNCGDNGTMTTQADVDAVNKVLDDLLASKIKTYVIGYDTTDAASAMIMDSFAMHGGTEKQYPVENQQTLVDELTRIAGSLVPCSFDLTTLPDDPTFVRVEIDGKTYTYGTDWTLDGSKIVLDPMGGACPKLRDAKVHDLRITRECTPVQVL